MAGELPPARGGLELQHDMYAAYSQQLQQNVWRKDAEQDEGANTGRGVNGGDDKGGTKATGGLPMGSAGISQETLDKLTPCPQPPAGIHHLEQEASFAGLQGFPIQAQPLHMRMDGAGGGGHQAIGHFMPSMHGKVAGMGGEEASHALNMLHRHETANQPAMMAGSFQHGGPGMSSIPYNWGNSFMQGPGFPMSFAPHFLPWQQLFTDNTQQQMARPYAQHSGPAMQRGMDPTWRGDELMQQGVHQPPGMAARMKMANWGDVAIAGGSSEDDTNGTKRKRGRPKGVKDLQKRTRRTKKEMGIATKKELRAQGITVPSPQQQHAAAPAPSAALPSSAPAPTSIVHSVPSHPTSSSGAALETAAPTSVGPTSTGVGESVSIQATSDEEDAGSESEPAAQKDDDKEGNESGVSSDVSPKNEKQQDRQEQPRASEAVQGILHEAATISAGHPDQALNLPSENEPATQTVQHKSESGQQVEVPNASETAEPLPRGNEPEQTSNASKHDAVQQGNVSEEEGEAQEAMNEPSIKEGVVVAPKDGQGDVQDLPQKDMQDDVDESPQKGMQGEVEDLPHKDMQGDMEESPEKSMQGEVEESPQKGMQDDVDDSADNGMQDDMQNSPEKSMQVDAEGEA